MSDRGDGWNRMREVLSRVAVGPKGSKDLDREGAREAMTLCLQRSASDIQIATFLIAERLKRETTEENLGFLDALQDASTIVKTSAPEVVSLCDPHDGFIRAPHFAPVTAAILAACGLPTVVNGALTLAPKNGITPRQVMTHMGFKLDIGDGTASVERASERLATRGIAYVDVEDFCPSLSALNEIRTEMAKRPFLATLEKLITPIRGSETTHIVAGWVHSGYETLLTELMRERGMASTLLIRSVEGHIDPKVHVTTKTTGYRPDGQSFDEDIEPKCYGTLISEPPDWGTVDIDRVAETWVEALDTRHRTAPGQIVRLLAGMVLSHTGRAATIMRGVGLAHQQITSGRARAHFELLST